jgi:hypothetical protein
MQLRALVGDLPVNAEGGRQRREAKHGGAQVGEGRGRGGDKVSALFGQ